MGHTCTDPRTCPVCHPERGFGIDMAPDTPMPMTDDEMDNLRLRTGGGPFFTARVGIPAGEHERDEVTDRDRTRRIVYKAVDIALDAVLNTPGDRILDPARLWQESTPSAVTAMREYRARARSRLMYGTASAPDEPTDPAELTCQDP